MHCTDNTTIQQMKSESPETPDADRSEESLDRAPGGGGSFRFPSRCFFVFSRWPLQRRFWEP